MTQETTQAATVEARARELCAASAAAGQELACLWIAIDRLARAEPPLQARLRAAVLELLLRAPEAAEWRVVRAGSELVALCQGLSLPAAGALARGLVDGARGLRVAVEGRVLRLRLSIGLAHVHNHPGLSFEALLGVARESLSVAQAAGGDRWVHTELYDLLMRHPRPVEGMAQWEELAAGREPPGAPPAAPGPGVLIPAARAESREPAPPAPAKVGELLHVLAIDRPRAGEELEGPDGRVELLERRVNKLLRALEQAEGEIQRLQRETGAERGIASIYRTVQGLDDDAPLRDLKLRLMQEIFRANRELRVTAG